LDTTSSGADEVGQALQKMASTAENSGITMEKAASWLATISSVTRESAAVIGNSLKSVVSRYEQIKAKGFNDEDATNLNEVTKALTAIGIQAVDSSGQLRPFAEVMDELGAKYKSLSKNEQAYITTTLFGSFQRNRGITLLNNYNQSLVNYETALNSAGTAQQKFNIYQESSQASLDKLKSSLDGVIQQSFQSNAFKGIIDSVTYLVQTFGSLKTIVTLAGTALLLWKGSKITNIFKDMTFSLSGVISGIRVYLTQMAMARGVTEEAAMSMSTLNLAFKANPFGLIATAIAGDVIDFDIYKQKQEEMNQKILDSVDKYKQQQSEIKGLVDSYKQNAELAKTDENAKNKLLEIETQLVSIFGESASKIDLQNGSIQDNINQIKESNRQKAESYILENQLIAQKKQQELDSKKYGTPRVTSSKSELGATYYGLETAKPLFKTGIDAKEFKKQLEDLLKEINKDDGQFKNLTPEIRLKLSEDIKEKLESVNKEINTSNQLIDSFKNAFKTATEDTIVGLDDLNSEQKKVYENLAKSLNLDINNTKDYQENLQKVVDIVRGYNGKNIDDVVTKLKELPSLANVDWNKVLNVQSSKKSTNEISSNIKQLTTDFDTQTDKIRDLYDIIKQLNDGGLSDTSAKNIIKNYKELIPYLGNEVELRQHINTLIADQEKVQKETYANMVSLDENFYKDKILVNTELVKEIKDVYNIDLNNYKSLAEAKFNVENELITKLSEKWGSFYDVQSNVFTSQFQQFKSAVPYGVAVEVENQINSQVKQVENAKKRFMDIALNNVDFDLSKINIPKPKDPQGGSSYQTDTTDVKESTIEKDYLAAITQRIALKESEIKINQALQETAKDDAKVELLKKEIELRKQLMSLTEEEADKYRTRRDELVSKLQGYNIDDLKINFTGIGEGYKGDNVQSTNAIDVLNTQKDKINELVNQYNNASKSMQKSIGNELKVEKEKLQDLETAINSFYDITSTKIPDAQEKWVNLNKAIGSINGNIDEIAKKKLEEQEKLVKETTDKISDIIKKRYDDELKEIEKTTQANQDKLDKDLEATKKSVDAQIDEIDRLYNKQKYNQSVEDSNKTILEKQKKINELSPAANSGDLNAINQIKDLEKDLEEERKKLADTNADRQRDVRKQNLQDYLKVVEEETKAEKEKNENDLKDAKEKYEKLTDSVALELEAQKSLMNGYFLDTNNKVVVLTDLVKGYYLSFGVELTTVNQKLQNELNSNIELAKTALKSLNEVEIAKAKIGELQSKYDKASDSDKAKYKTEADALRVKYNLPFEDLRNYKVTATATPNMNIDMYKINTSILNEMAKIAGYKLPDTSKYNIKNQQPVITFNEPIIKIEKVADGSDLTKYVDLAADKVIKKINKGAYDLGY